MYAGARYQDYVSSIKGTNCAVRREALEVAGAFEADVPTGTDYHLGRRLHERGYRIRYVSDSLNKTKYSETLRSYVGR